MTRDLAQRVPGAHEIPPGRFDPLPLDVLEAIATAVGVWADKTSPGTGDPASPYPGDTHRDPKGEW